MNKRDRRLEQLHEANFEDKIQLRLTYLVICVCTYLAADVSHTTVVASVKNGDLYSPPLALDSQETS